MRPLTLLIVLAACGDKDPEKTDDTSVYDPTGGDDTAACESEDGQVKGLITGPYSADPNPNGVAYATNGTLNPHVQADETGHYELTLPAGHWTVYASAEGCYSSDIELDLAACETVPLDFAIDDCAVADKPNLYLYPQRDTPTRVTIQHTARQAIVASDPPYARGWSGVAHPDGTFSVDGQRAPFLFYEVSLAPWQSRRLQRQRGWCLAPRTAVQDMADILTAYGFNATETDDFIEAWRLDLPPATTWAVYPQLRVDDMADLLIQPALPVSRLWLLLDDAPACAIAQTPVVRPFDRRGAHAVEWGLVLGDAAR